MLQTSCSLFLSLQQSVEWLVFFIYLKSDDAQRSKVGDSQALNQAHQLDVNF